MIERRKVLLGGALGAGALASGRAWAQAAAAPTTSAPMAAPVAPPALPPAPAGAVRIVMVTAPGLITLDLYADKAPITSGSFLKYVDRHMYDGGHFYRAVKVADNPLYGLMQGGIKNPAAAFPGIPHESTEKTGVHHVDGAISLARGALGSAKADFFICVGDLTSSMDANPKAPGDNQGFAAFGRVVAGMDVVKAMLVMKTSPTLGPEAMRGTFLADPVTITSMKRVAG
jgi:peptidyl-prolyl cis-trans isomerase A (cyclophilin A)